MERQRCQIELVETFSCRNLPNQGKYIFVAPPFSLANDFSPLQDIKIMLIVSIWPQPMPKSKYIHLLLHFSFGKSDFVLHHVRIVFDCLVLGLSAFLLSPK